MSVADGIDVCLGLGAGKGEYHGTTLTPAGKKAPDAYAAALIVPSLAASPAAVLDRRRLPAARIEELPARLARLPRLLGGDGFRANIVKGWIALATRSLGHIDVGGKSVARTGETGHLIVQSLQP